MLRGQKGEVPRKMAGQGGALKKPWRGNTQAGEGRDLPEFHGECGHAGLQKEGVLAPKSQPLTCKMGRNTEQTLQCSWGITLINIYEGLRILSST